MQEIASLINMRFPKPAGQPSTWQEIIDHHNQALREQKEAIKKAQIEARRRQHQMEETIKAALLIAGIVGVAVGLFIFLFASILGA
jgi:hypothetical protein